MLLDAGVPARKIVIGAAFYGRFFQIEKGNPVDLYQPCKFLYAFSSKHMTDTLSAQNGFEVRWDSVAQAPYAIHNSRQLLATYDDERSVALKTRYAVERRLGGIMFWQLYDDKFKEGLLSTIVRNAQQPRGCAEGLNRFAQPKLARSEKAAMNATTTKAITSSPAALPAIPKVIQLLLWPAISRATEAARVKTHSTGT
jgi:GH18 family chitinase